MPKHIAGMTAASQTKTSSRQATIHFPAKVILNLVAFAVLAPSVANAQTFNDVPNDYWAYDYIETLYASGITGGCGGGNYCPEDPVTRAQMAVFLERAIHGSSYQPPPATGNLFLDVAANDFAAAFIEQLFNEGITGGCGGNNYCPTQEITRAQMAVFLLRAKHGSAYSPPPAAGIFNDVDLSYWAVGWIEQLKAEGITTGCSPENYCPDQTVTRAQMAAFLVRAFGLGQATPPNAPFALAVGSATSNSLTLSWTDNSDNETGFRIYRASSQFGTFNQIATTSATSYTNTGLSASTTYWYKVSAFNDAGESAQTGAASGTTSAPPLTPPSAPSGLTVGNATSSALTLNWTDNSNNETGFRIYRANVQGGPYTQIATTSATSYTNTGLSASTTYWYKVSAFNDAGESAQTNAASGATLAPPVTVPSAPTDPVVSNISSSSATLSWTDNSNNETGFQVGFCSGLVTIGNNDVRTCLTGFTVLDQVGANVTSYTFTGLSADTQYSRFVRAYNNAGNSTNTGARFTTALGQQSVILQAIASNVVMSNSLDSSWANTAYPNSFPTVGIQWASSLAGFPSSLAFAGLVRFDVSSLQGRTIDSATLNLEVNTAPVGFFPQNFDIGTVASSWNPSTVTWNQMSSFQFYNAGWQRNFSYPTFPGQTYAIDLTAVVQAWANGVFSNNGLGFLSSNYGVFPGNITSLDAYDFLVPTLTVEYH